MKQFLFFCIFLALSGGAFAQAYNPFDVSCGIFYTYDANGARILRKDDCVEPDVEHPVGASWNPIIYPNPTSGPFTVSYNELVASATMTIIAINGTHIAAIESGQGYELHYDISDHVPGTYIVSLQVVRDDGTSDSEEFTLIKNE
ncbi:MAG TPA: T9SS type A sorting domain-containing protein [Flavipsychrobacter sp.]|nr:T9SS type A sorting domain-containing protein [Flavipsychrobacter sp.]